MPETELQTDQERPNARRSLCLAVCVAAAVIVGFARPPKLPLEQQA